MDFPFETKRFARFQPKNTDTLRPEMLPLIGRTFTFVYAGDQPEDSAFAGQRIWYIDREQEKSIPEDARAKWIPDEDLVEVAA